MEDSSHRWWSKETVALVTGSNKGIGFQLVREFATRGITTILTSRDEANGHKAMRQLQDEEGLHDVLVFHQLDVTSADSVSTLARWVSKTFGAIDILVNNAGITSSSFLEDSKTGNFTLNKERMKLVFETNYYGSKRMIETFLPLMKPGGRIVNMSSKTGDLNYLTNEWRSRLDEPSNLTSKIIDNFVEEYQQAALKEEVKARGFSCIGTEMKVSPEYVSDYSTSKIALNAYTRMVAPEVKDKYQTSINCICPGLTSTSLTAFNGHSVEAGADTAVWLALLPSSSELPNGRFFIARKDVGFSGQPLYFEGRTAPSLGVLTDPDSESS